MQAQGRELLVDLAQFGLLVSRKGGTVAHKILMVFLHHADLLVVQTHFVAVLIHIVDALEKFWVHHNGIAMFREHGQHLLGDGNHFIVGQALVEVEEHIAYSIESFARLVERKDGVLEGWSLGIVGNGFDFSLLLLDARLKSRHVMLDFNLVEWRHLERCRVLGQEGIRACGLGFLFGFRST